ncbi:hypothetical protein CERSUDRAFT_96289 [Gelatoporia subvermispora B]|uniref:SAC3/GANP/THP3 conserved domain-containing protein n=1 Tax=Ceriporiopsis subvermispora (strain B) TaxID=914234 RepID=M2RCD5_CERS8|nr:hypothetical protein CERSUDRAFT_96289 [Gelatoporia subvermispora B]
MDAALPSRGRGLRIQGTSSGGRVLHKNKKWVARRDGTESPGHGSDGERWERGGHHSNARGGRGRASPYPTSHLAVPDTHELEEVVSGTDDEQGGADEVDEPVHVDEDPESPEEREKLYHELVKAREIERKKAIAEGKMADPNVPRRLDEAITMVGTCMDMCPRIERYRREREHLLDKWEVVPGTRRVDHRRAVKIYERGAGDKIIPSDLRPPPVLKKTLDYLFHDLLVRGGFAHTYSFIRDRTRAVRSDFTVQHQTGELAIECHDRIARFHVLALHLGRPVSGFDINMEEQQLKNTLQSLIEFYIEERGRYQAPTELEMRVYHVLIHIRGQRERNDPIPNEILSDPVYITANQFRQRVQTTSAPVTKNSPLKVDAEAMRIFGQLVDQLREQCNFVMMYLVACILERHFGEETIENIEAIRGDLTNPDIIDGISTRAEEMSTVPNGVTESPASIEEELMEEEQLEEEGEEEEEEEQEVAPEPTLEAKPIARTATEWLTNNFGATPSAFANDISQPAQPPPVQPPAFATTSSQPAKSAFGNLTSTPNVFNSGSVFGGSPFAQPAATEPVKSIFGTSVFGSSTVTPTPSITARPDISPASSLFPPPPSTLTTQPALPFATTPEPSIQKPYVPSTNGFALAAPSQPNPPAASSSPPSLNPFASSLSPSAQPSLFSGPSKTPFFTPPPTAEPAQPEPVQPAVEMPPRGPFNPPATPTFKPPSTAAAPSPPGAPTISAASPQPHIVERRQTLWELPGTPPPKPRLGVDVSPTALGNSTTAPGLASPAIPPPLGKMQPLSLPPTPTARWFDPGSQPKPADPALARKKSLFGFPPLQMPSGPSTSGMLSPLLLHSPGKRSLGEPESPSQQRPEAPLLFASPSMPVRSNGRVSPKGKGKQVATGMDARTRALVKKCVDQWRKNAAETAAWKAAIGRSDAYSDKIQRERLSSSVGPSPRSKGRADAGKKRRASSGGPGETSHFKRADRRLSTPYTQRSTDEELARRLKENHEEHERRWAHASFLQAIRTRVKDASPTDVPPKGWRLWLSLNPENDGTAIWLEHKFDVPASGDWQSQTVFSIPLIPKSKGGVSRGGPGLLVFERTPLEGLEDEIDKKYRILEDCARLRDIIRTLPPAEDLRYTPSLLVINWTEEKATSTVADFDDMVQRLHQDGVIGTVVAFSVSSTAKDLDARFSEVLKTLTLDLRDRRSMAVTWKELVDRFVTPVVDIASDWLDSCWPDDGRLDAARWNQVADAISEVQFSAISKITSLASDPTNLPPMPSDLPHPGDAIKAYALEVLLDTIAKEITSVAQRAVGARLRPRYILSQEKVDAYVQELERVLEHESDGLRQPLAIPTSPSIFEQAVELPQRRPMDEGYDSPSPPSKRRRTSSPFEDGEATFADRASVSPPPSTSASTTGHTESADRPIVTAAMLRALTQNVLKTYGRA